MPKRKPGEEIFKDGNRDIRMVADFGFLVAVNECGRDVSAVYSDLSEGAMPPEDVRNVIACAADLPEGTDRTAFVEDLITRYGLQECAILARIMLSHAMIGDVKKSAIDRHDVLRGVLDLEQGVSRSAIFLRVGLLWAATVTASTALVCLISSLSGLPT